MKPLAHRIARKGTLLFFRVFAFVLLAAPAFSGAQANPTFGNFNSQGTKIPYQLLAPLPFIPQKNFTLAQFIQGYYKLIIAGASVAAVLAGVVSGLEYMFTDVPGVKNTSLKRFKGAVYGLLLIAGGPLILETIYPGILNFNLNLPQVTLSGAAPSSPPPGGGNPGGGNPGGGNPGTYTAGSPWPDDSATRAKLTQNGIGINKGNCSTVGQSNCTSVYGLSSRAVDGLIKLKKDCKCDVTVTGGTEYWAHHGNISPSNTACITDISCNPTGHKPGRSVVDLSATQSLNQYLGGTGYACHKGPSKNGAQFEWEPGTCFGASGNHWHVKF